jgi:hypothetical protein
MKPLIIFMKKYCMPLIFFLPEIIHVYFFNIKKLESGEVVAGGREEISNSLYTQQARVNITYCCIPTDGQNKLATIRSTLELCFQSF